MKPTPVLILLLTLLLIYSACKKDSHQPPPLVPKVKTVAWLSNQINYFYDAGGRVSRIEFVSNGKTTKNTYLYTDTAVLVSTFDTANNPTGQTVYKLGPNGMVIAHYNVGSANDQTTQTYTTRGQLLTSTETRVIPNVPVLIWATQYYYTNDNLDSMLETFNQNPPGTYLYTYYDAYYTDKRNTLGNANFGQGWMGASSVNPPKLARDIGRDGAGNYPQTSYTYDYDSLSRIVKQYHMLGSTLFSAVSYTYY